jgi:hypothetical protein
MRFPIKDCSHSEPLEPRADQNVPHPARNTLVPGFGRSEKFGGGQAWFTSVDNGAGSSAGVRGCATSMDSTGLTDSGTDLEIMAGLKTLNLYHTLVTEGMARKSRAPRLLVRSSIRPDSALPNRRSK